MNISLYKAWMEFAKAQGYICNCSTSSFIFKSRFMCIPKTMRIFFKNGGVSQVVKVGSRNYLCWLAYRYSQDLRFVLKFIFTNWKTGLCLCKVFPETAVWIDLNDKHENMIVDVVDKCIENNDHLHEFDSSLFISLRKTLSNDLKTQDK